MVLERYLGYPISYIQHRSHLVHDFRRGVLGGLTGVLSWRRATAGSVRDGSLSAVRTR
jgi:hypothetical protein